VSSLDPIPFKEVEPKPPMFPFFRKPQVKKKWVDLSQVTDKKFGKELAKNIKSEEKASYSKEQKKATLNSTIQVSTLQKGIANLGLGVISNIDQTNNKSNQEFVHETNYVKYNKLLKNETALTAQAQQIVTDEIKKKKRKEDNKLEEDSEDGENAVDTVGKGHTYVHN